MAGATRGADLALEWADTNGVQALDAGVQYRGRGLSPASGTWMLQARFSGSSGGPTADASVEVDFAGPSFTVLPVGLPNYGASDGGFIDSDPAAPNAVKKDETVTLRVESTDTDVDPASVVLSLATVDGGEAWGVDAGMPCSSGSAFCREYALPLGPQPMNNFVDSVRAAVTGADDVGNPGGGDAGLVLTVTRWKWARQVSATYGLRTTPALADGGVVLVGINGAAMPNGVVAVKPDGTFAWGPTNDGPVEGSAAVGRDNTGTEYVLYQLSTATNPVKSVGAQSGVVVGNTCNGASGTATKASLAILRDTTGDVMAVGVQPASTANQAVSQRPLASCRDTGTATAYSSVQFSGNVVGLGDEAYWVGSNGNLRGAQWNAGPVTVTPLTTNVSVGGVRIVNGLAALSGTRIVGGGPGIGRLFAFDVPGGTPAWPMATPLSTPTSGPVVLSNGVVAALRSMNDRVQLIRVGSTDGMQAALTPELQSKGLTSSFTNTQVPTPVAGQGQLLYVVDEAGRVFVLPGSFGNSTQPSWAVALPSQVAGAGTQVTASPALDCNRTRVASGTGVLYLATESGWLVSYIVDSRGLDTSAPWPKYQRDGWNTGNSSTMGYGPPCP